MPAGRPNVVIVLTDQQQGAMLGCAGAAGLRTPAIDRLAAGGVRFARAFCTTPQCSPSRSSLLTGLYPHRTRVRSNIPDTTFGPPQLPTDLPQLGTALRDAGYQTAYFGKWHLGESGNPATDPRAYGFAHFEATHLHSQVESEDSLAAAAAAHLRAHDGAAPLLLVASFNDPHGVYALRQVREPLDGDAMILPASFSDDLRCKPSPQRVYRDEDQPADLPLDEATARRYLAWYAQMIERADGYLDRIVGAIADHAALAANTIVVFASDHGDLAAAHRLPFKGPCMYEELIRVPLILCGPTIAPGLVRDELVTLADLFPTLCDLAGLATPPGLDGASLRPLLRDGAGSVTWRDAIIGQYHGKQRWSCPIRMIRTKTHKLVLYRTGERELYDLVRDPHEIENLAGRADEVALERSLADRLIAWMAEHGDDFERQILTDRSGSIVGV